MPAIRRRLNYCNIVLGDGPSTETIGVRRLDGTFGYLPWAGFLPLEEARALAAARPVLLTASAVTAGDGFTGEWSPVSEGQYIQGCLVGGRIYGVLEAGTPRIIDAPAQRQPPDPT